MGTLNSCVASVEKVRRVQHSTWYPQYLFLYITKREVDMRFSRSGRSVASITSALPPFVSMESLNKYLTNQRMQNDL